MKGTAKELKEGAAKTGSQAADAAEQAAASAQTSTSDSQQDTAQESASQAERSGQTQAGSGSEQGPDQAQGAGAKAGAPGASSIMTRLRSMASMVQREVRDAMSFADSCSEECDENGRTRLDEAAWLHEHDDQHSNERHYCVRANGNLIATGTAVLLQADHSVLQCSFSDRIHSCACCQMAEFQCRTLAMILHRLGDRRLQQHISSAPGDVKDVSEHQLSMQVLLMHRLLRPYCQRLPPRLPPERTTSPCAAIK